MIEDATYKCDGCNTRIIVHPSHQEQARLDGTLGLKNVTEGDSISFRMGDGAIRKEVLPGAPRAETFDRVLVEIPAGWDRRFGGRGTGFYHRCPDCIRIDVKFS